MIKTFTSLVHTIAGWGIFISLATIALSFSMRFTSFIPEPYTRIKGLRVPEFLFICGLGVFIISSALFKSPF